MKEFLGALNTYHILNFMVPGVLFTIVISHFTTLDLLQENTFHGIILYYVVGMLLSRLGSLVIEPLFKVVRILGTYDYEDYIKAIQVDKKIPVLLEMNNMYRGLTATAIVLLLLYAFKPFGFSIPDMGEGTGYFLMVLICFILAFAWQKQNGYIKNRVTVLKKNNFALPKTNASRAKND